MSENVITLTDANFESEVVGSGIPVLVDFWAEWCGPCRMMTPVIEKLAETYKGRLKVGKLNVDDNRMTAGRYGIRSIPTIIFFRNGEVSEQIVGAVGEDKLKAKLGTHGIW